MFGFGNDTIIEFNRHTSADDTEVCLLNYPHDSRRNKVAAAERLPVIVVTVIDQMTVVQGAHIISGSLR